jgi:hypothetical protein
MDFCTKSAFGSAKRLALLPPFAPAAETWARTMVDSNIWTRWADVLSDAKVSNIASNTPDLLNPLKRF